MPQIRSARARRRPAGGPRRRSPGVPMRGAQLVALADDFLLTDVVSHLLRRAHFRAEELFAEEFGKDHLTPRQKALLITVYQYPGVKQHELARRIALDRNSLGEMLTRMVSQGYVERRRAAEDGRANRVLITQKGVELLRRIMPRDAEVESRVIEPLPAEYRPLFVKCLKIMVGLDQ